MGLIVDESRPTAARRVVVVVPSAFTLGNLFFGFWSIVSAFNGNFIWAGWFIVFAGLLDMMDGRLARLSKAGTKFGAELDSLVDVISFGVAPALLLYFLEFAQGGKFAWVVSYLYVAAVAIRLARYNVAAATKPHSQWFTGMPSPSAGMTIATFYPFSQTEWYQRSLAYLDLEKQGLVVLTLLLAVLMVSNVQYPRWPAIGFRTAKGLLGLAVHLVILAGALLTPRSFLFPLGLFYLLFGLARALVIGLNHRRDEDLAVPSPGEAASPAVTPITRRRRAAGDDEDSNG